MKTPHLNLKIEELKKKIDNIYPSFSLLTYKFNNKHRNNKYFIFAFQSSNINNETYILFVKNNIVVGYMYVTSYFNGDPYSINLHIFLNKKTDGSIFYDYFCLWANYEYRYCIPDIWDREFLYGEDDSFQELSKKICFDKPLIFNKKAQFIKPLLQNFCKKYDDVKKELTDEYDEYVNILKELSKMEEKNDSGNSW